MLKNTKRLQRGEESLSRERIVAAAIDLLDGGGEAALTFRALAQQLATGAGAIYYHVTDKGDLLCAASDTIVLATMAAAAATADATPRQRMGAMALGLFDAIDTHPWLGAALMQAPSQMPMVRILEALGQQGSALGVPPQSLWQLTSALLHYILGVAGQNAANSRAAQAQATQRETFLDTVATAWEQLDAEQFPFTRGIAGQLRAHDDRADFLAGIDLLLAGAGAGAYATTAGK
jgi:AcrR family transcriptional regulator